jgi:hypothetical protein
MDHVRAKLRTKQANHQNKESISQNCERNHKGDKNGASPWTLQEEIRCQHARDEEHPTRPDSATLLRHFDDNSGQLKHGSIAEHRRAGYAEE